MKRMVAIVGAGIMLCVGGASLVRALGAAGAAPGGLIDHSVYASGRQVNVKGEINGDVYCVGQKVTITATVHGDVVCAGQSLTINGRVDGSVRAVGQTLTLNAPVGGSASLAGQVTTVTHTATVGRDLSVLALQAEVEGAVGRDAHLDTTTLTLNSSVARNATLKGKDLTLGDRAVIGGDLDYMSASTINETSGAAVRGITNHRQVTSGGHHFSLAPVLLPMLLMFFTFAMLLVFAFPQWLHTVARIPAQKLSQVIGVGLLSAIVIPIVLTLLIISVVGIMAAAFVFLAGMLLILVSGPVAAYYVGSMILAKSKNAPTIMAAGAIVLIVLYILPTVGFIVAGLAYMIGAGSVLIHLKRRFKKPRYAVS